MPKRKGNIFSEKDISHITGGKPVNVGQTKTIRYLIELRDSIANPHEVNPYFHRAKIHFKQGTFKNGQGKAQIVFLKPVMGMTREDQAVNAKKEVELFKRMKNAGLPVPKTGVVIHKEQAYIAVEPFLRNGQKSVLMPINSRHGYSKPVFLSKLSVKRNSSLIIDLAKDLATIANLNISTEYFDLHGFYKKRDGTLTRIIMDTNHLKNCKFTSHEIKSIVSEIKKVWQRKRYSAEKKLFIETLLKNINDLEMKERFRVAFAEMPFWKLFIRKIS
jgi:hypothetical protein